MNLRCLLFRHRRGAVNSASLVDPSGKVFNYITITGVGEIDVRPNDGSIPSGFGFERFLSLRGHTVDLKPTRGLQADTFVRSQYSGSESIRTIGSGRCVAFSRSSNARSRPARSSRQS